jgi:hypothetical protein
LFGPPVAIDSAIIRPGLLGHKKRAVAPQTHRDGVRHFPIALSTGSSRSLGHGCERRDDVGVPWTSSRFTAGLGSGKDVLGLLR